MKMLTCFFLLYPSLSMAAELRVRSLYGDRDVRFHIVKDASRVKVDRIVDSGPVLSREIKVEEWSYLIENFQKLPKPQKVPAECDRARMDIVYIGPDKKQEIRASCIGLKTITSDQYARFAQILGLLF